MNKKIELHLHVKGTSHCARVDAQQIALDYNKAKYSAIVCTNHWNISSIKTIKGLLFNTKVNNFISVYHKLENACKKYGIRTYFGLELALENEDYKSTRSDCAEILVYGITCEEFKKYNKQILKMSHSELHTLATNLGWVLIQSHPYRNKTKVLSESDVDGIEIHNSHAGHNNRNELAFALMQQRNCIGTCGSDYHEIGMEGSGILVNQLPENEKSLALLLKTKDFIISPKNN